jgi:heme exporter protein A
MLIAKNIFHRCGHRLLIKDISFTLKPTELLLIKGDNGHGKTTLLHILSKTGLPHHHIQWQGFSGQQVRFITHALPLKNLLTVQETHDRWQILYGRPNIVHDAWPVLCLNTYRHQAVHTLSAGLKMRLNLVRLVYGHSRLWLLDEPQTGLDASTRTVLETMIRQFLDTGGMVVLVSHWEMSIKPHHTITLTPTLIDDTWERW